MDHAGRQMLHQHLKGAGIELVIALSINELNIRHLHHFASNRKPARSCHSTKW